MVVRAVEDCAMEWQRRHLTLKQSTMTKLQKTKHKSQTRGFLIPKWRSRLSDSNGHFRIKRQEEEPEKQQTDPTERGELPQVAVAKDCGKGGILILKWSTMTKIQKTKHKTRRV